VKRVVIVQPYVPSYRVPLFRQLHARLNELGVNLEVVHGRPSKRQEARNDQATLEFAHGVRSFQIEIFGRSLRWKSLGRSVRGADLVISELASGALENYWLALRPSTVQALWGHGYATTSAPNKLDSMLERWLMRRANHVFLYTERGRVAATAAGINSTAITVLNNTVDTAELSAAIERLSDEDVAEFRATHDLGTGPCCAFIGGLDESKRIDWLLVAGSRLASLIPGFRLLVAGDGPDRERVESAARTTAWLTYLGRVDDDGKALIAATCALLLNPGRVGLVAVDAFVMGTPVATTTWPRHAPEFDYLVDGENAAITADSLDDFVSGVATVMNSPSALHALTEGCRSSATRYSLDAMVDRFVGGILDCLENRANAKGVSCAIAQQS
jgi:glycosyltransferase involved in cell wall biosynthesis